MNKFDRKFDVTALHGTAVDYLFSHWVLPGEKLAHDQPALRIGIRNGYLNLYVRGQSVAKVSVGKEGPVFEVHPKFVEGRCKPLNRGAVKQSAQRNVRLNASAISNDDIDCWIATATTYASEEKAFVEDLVAANPGVIDLEMGLPALRNERSAPRMDLVAAQGGDVVFWEAKCCGNAELRSSSDYLEEAGEYKQGIHVVHQLRKYVQWMDNPGAGNRQAVLAAYRKTACLLVKLAEHFGNEGDRAIAAWKTLRDNADAQLILAPGLVVAGYNALNREMDCSRTVANNESYFRILHDRHGAKVHRIPGPESCILPALIPHVVRA